MLKIHIISPSSGMGVPDNFLSLKLIESSFELYRIMYLPHLRKMKRQKKLFRSYTVEKRKFIQKQHSIFNDHNVGSYQRLPVFIPKSNFSEFLSFLN
jgi:hypothetical protein